MARAPADPQAATGEAGPPALATAVLAAGICALAINLRAAITSLPPVFPELSASLHLSSAMLAVLAAAPVLCFGVFSGFAAPLSRRLGEERVLGAALVLLAAGLALRGAFPGALLFPGTILAGAAIALMNVLLPSLVKRRRPAQAGLLVGSYLLLLSAGAVLASLLAVPVFNAAGSPAWAVRLTLGLWALPALAAALGWLPQLRYRTRPQPVPQRSGGLRTLTRQPLAWQVTAFMGLQSLSYYAALSWFPTLLRGRGISAGHAGDLLALMNFGNAVSALLVPVLAHRAASQRWLVTVSTAATTGGLIGAAFGSAGAATPWMLLLGLGQGATLGLGIFFTMARAPDPVTAAALSAFAQGGGYLLASAGPVLLGFLHGLTGGWTVPVIALLGVVAGQQLAGWLSGRALTVVPLGGRWPPASPGR